MVNKAKLEIMAQHLVQRAIELLKERNHEVTGFDSEPVFNVKLYGSKLKYVYLGNTIPEEVGLKVFIRNDGKKLRLYASEYCTSYEDFRRYGKPLWREGTFRFYNYDK